MRHLEVHVAAIIDGTGDERGARDFLNMISSNNTLETFKIQIHEGSGGDLESLIFETPMPGVRHFSLTGGAHLILSELQAFVQRNPNLQRLDLLGTKIMRGTFSDEYLDNFEDLGQSDVPDLVRKFVDLPGGYVDLWSDDVYVKFERVPMVASLYDLIFL